MPDSVSQNDCAQFDRNTPSFDSQSLRDTLGCFATGVVVATTVGDKGAPVGLTINSFSSVSLEPPLILWSIALTAPSLEAFRSHPTFCINILSEQQKSLCMQFAKPAEDKFNGVSWRVGLGGAPIIENAHAVLQCETYERYAGGDHEIYLGKVVQIDHADKKPLIFHRGQFLALPDELPAD